MGEYSFRDKNIVGSDVAKYCKHCNKGYLFTQCCNDDFYEPYKFIRKIDGYLSCWEVKDCLIRAEIGRKLNKRDI